MRQTALLLARRAIGIMTSPGQLKGAGSTKSKSIGWALADQALVSGTSFLTTIIAARLLGAEEFGRFAIAWLIVVLCQNVHSAIMIDPLMTIGSIWPADERSHYLGALLQQQLIFSICAAVLLFCGASTIGYLLPAWQISELALPLALAVAAGPTAELFRGRYYAVLQPRGALGLDLMRYSAQLVLLFFLLFLPHYASAGMVLGLIAAAAAVAGLTGALLLPQVRWSAAALRQVSHRHWVFSRWLLGSSTIGTARELFANVAVGAVLGLADVGLLRAAQQIVLVVNVPLQGLGRLAMAYASRAYFEGGVSGLWAFTRAFVLPYMATIAAMLLAIAATSTALVGLVYGQAYSAAGPLLTAFAFIMMIYLGREIFFIIARALQKPAWEFVACLVGASVSVLLLIPLMWGWGIAGALVAEALYLALSSAIAALLLRSWQKAPHGSSTESFESRRADPIIVDRQH